MTKKDEKKDCIFLLADKMMESTFKGFLGRNNFHLNLGTGPFTAEIIVDRQGRDSGVYKRAHEFLRGYHSTHGHAVAVLDNAWEGSPGASIIEATIKDNLMRNGWREENVEVIVIEPELEIWLWQDSPSIAGALRFDHSPYPTLKKWLEAKGFWQDDALKPARPKEAFEHIARKSGFPISGATYARMVQQLSVRRCTDPAFCQLRATLQCWFPQNGDNL
jgi:hypothetical protein